MYNPLAMKSWSPYAGAVRWKQGGPLHGRRGRRHNPFLQFSSREEFKRHALSTAPPEPTSYKRMKKLNAVGPQVWGGMPTAAALSVGAFKEALDAGRGELTGEWLPGLWQERFGDDSLAWRLLAATAGGAIMAFGARMAGGCTSGHGISGTLQLAVGSWIAAACFFAGGVITAQLLYRL